MTPTINNETQQPEGVEAMVASRLNLNFPRRSVSTLSNDDVQDQGRTLGVGAFSSVIEVNMNRSVLMSLSNDAKEEADHSIASDLTEDTFLLASARSSSAQSVADTSNSRRASQTHHYALKRLRADLKTNPGSGKIATEDLLLEVEILTRLPTHPNIIQVAGLSEGFHQQPEEGFVLLERLEETLQARLGRWERAAQFHRQLSGVRVWNLPARRKLDFQEQRHRIAAAALGVSRALAHLHQFKIIYRDLKPQNIGFDSRGQVKLFDFGMSRSCNSLDVQKKMTGSAGTPRYMSPEVATHQVYGLSADVYSFGMVLWQICCLKKPFGSYAELDDWFRAAVLHKKRPSLKPIASPAVRDLIQVCWDADPEARPTFALVSRQLEVCVSHQKPSDARA